VLKCHLKNVVLVISKPVLGVSCGRKKEECAHHWDARRVVDVYDTVFSVAQKGALRSWRRPGEVDGSERATRVGPAAS
jgi:hypothetical protein